MAENGKAKYYALMEEMKTDILSGKIRPGEKLPSENQLSVRYGLSRHTVRKALGILAGDGYIESFQGKGTFCADVLRQIHGTGNIAVVTTYISDYIFPRLIQGLYTEMQEKPHILMDDAGGGYLVTKHLLDSGRRNIAGFFKADDRQGIERHKGYVKALQEHGIAYDPDKVVWFHTEDRREKPALMVRNMVRQNSFPDGIVCYNDQIAVQVMEELERQGKKIPEDVAVTGYDNSLYARQGQGITTITHPQEKLGEMAAKLLLEKLSGVPDEESKVERLIRPELIVRGSSVKTGI